VTLPEALILAVFLAIILSHTFLHFLNVLAKKVREDVFLWAMRLSL